MVKTKGNKSTITDSLDDMIIWVLVGSIQFKWEGINRERERKREIAKIKEKEIIKEEDYRIMEWKNTNHEATVTGAVGDNNGEACAEEEDWTVWPMREQ